MTRYAVFGAGPIWGLELDADVSRALDSRALQTALQNLERDREGEPDVEWPPFTAAGLRAAAGLSDFTRLTVGPGLL
jgi:hypothetical protein